MNVAAYALRSIREPYTYGEIIKGRVMHLWQEKSVSMVRVASGNLVYNVPVTMLVDERKST